ncbi:MAG: NAD(P)H-hydrate epimerase [Candidatus Omnitrophica bacterium]|nr:NAD(P)H-hydrate epimerase [Candidatus Omnitrophota bacterium]
MRGPVTVRQIQDLDKTAIERYGIPSIVLMENAGRAVAEEVKKSLRGKENPAVCIVCGTGNNAGDGFVAARHLASAGIRTKVFLVGKARQLKHDAAVNYRILEKMKCPVKNAASRPAWALPEIARADVVVDAIFGVGLNRAVMDPFRSVIETISREAKYVVAVDIPSGLDGTSGEIYGVCVKADKTVTFSFPKKGFFTGRGPRQTGKVVVVDIGIPAQVIRKVLGNR